MHSFVTIYARDGQNTARRKNTLMGMLTVTFSYIQWRKYYSRKI